MTAKRYFERMWEEEYYIFDSETISENEFDEKVEYEDYQAFADSLTGDEVVELLNELHEENEDLATKKEDAEYELLHLKEMYEELLEEKEKYKKEMLYFKRELQKELVCQGGREKND